MNINLLKNLLQNSKKCSKIVRKALFSDNLSAANLVRWTGTIPSSQRRIFRNQILPGFTASRRLFSDENKENQVSSHTKLPPLMDVPVRPWPSILKSFKNFFVTALIIKPYFDPEFNLSDFVQGSKRAVQVVSHKLAKGQDLEGLVTSDLIPKLQERVSNMSVGQRDLIPVNEEDIIYTFPYEIGVIVKELATSNVQQRFVEITMIYHVLKGLSQIKSGVEKLPMNVGLLPDYQDKISICNYRFVKEFTKGVESDWTVNLLNHFRPVDDSAK
ncbi:m-AAA protease-interacting protein 1, mitochondrial [Anthonomus grandis grandis]|uniref:m-AAA protease-interacting protein 1, mitochondrial n=1 Tax=Anthonomus grandis grandis TaxID=2921223 RepID=UPI0021653696|nr:m-AAA protease-interacting protein 1, mitochondrial [Anthonomus grandis grandis]